MTSQNLIFSLTCSSLFFLSLHYSFQTSNANCTPSSCGLLRNITFPFRLSNDPKNCGDPKFELACENDVVSIHLNSNKYYVKAIDYRNYTMRVADVSVNSSNICFFPNSSSFDFSSPFESRSGSWLIHFISCQHPLHNSSGFTRVTACGKGGYTYIKVGELLVQDMDYTCTLEAVALTSWNFTDRNPSNASLSEIHQSLLYEFDLSWIMFECWNCEMGCFVGPVKLSATSPIMISTTTGAAEKGVQTKDCLHDAFEHIHRNKDGSYTDAKSERIANQIKDLAEVMAQPLPGTTEPRPVDWNKCYLEVTGGLDHKGRLFGGGTLAKTLMSSDSAATSQIDRQEIDNRLEEMEQRLERDQEERKQLYEQLERDQEERKQLYEQVQAQQKLIQELISKSSQFAPSS